MNLVAFFPPPVPALTCGKGRCLTKFFKNFGVDGWSARLGFQGIEIWVAKLLKASLKEVRTYFYQNNSESRKSC
jgi:hypothetical protein